MTSDIATVRQHVNCRARSSWTTATVLALGVLFSAYLASVRAHDSVAEVEAGFQQRNRYVQLTNETAGDFTLLDPDGQEFRLSDYRGKVIILNFLYSRCKEQCPQQSAKLAIVQRQLVKTGLASEVRFVTVATDTENAAGTAESLREQESRYGIAPVNWSFLHGGPGRESAGLRLAAEYGIKFETTADGEQMHVSRHPLDRSRWAIARALPWAEIRSGRSDRACGFTRGAGPSRREERLPRARVDAKALDRIARWCCKPRAIFLGCARVLSAATRHATSNRGAKRHLHSRGQALMTSPANEAFVASLIARPGLRCRPALPCVQCCGQSALGKRALAALHRVE